MSDLPPRGLNHVAYITTDTSKTKDSYTQVLKGEKAVGEWPSERPAPVA